MCRGARVRARDAQRLEGPDASAVDPKEPPHVGRLQGVMCRAQAARSAEERGANEDDGTWAREQAKEKEETGTGEETPTRKRERAARPLV